MATGRPRVCLLLGHPRSGSTFLHRFMLENHGGLAGKKLEDMMFLPHWPTALKPCKGVIRYLPLSWLYRPEIHHTGLQCWECDDVAFSIHCRAGYLFWLYGRCRRRARFEDSEFHDWVSRNRENVLTCWDKLYHGQLTSAGDITILSKSFIMLFYVEEFLARYPDARIIVLTRTPQAVVPSTISLVNSVCRRLFPFRKLHEIAIDNILQSVSLYYQRLSSVLANRSIADRCLHLRYEDVTTQLASGCKRISHHLGHSSWDEAALAAHCTGQGRRTSGHRYRASDFGLSEERIAREVPFA